MSNPFQPLSASEIQEAVAIFRKAHNDEKAVFCSSGLEEPAKSDVKAGKAVDRVVRFLGTDSGSDGGFEALVNLSKQQVDRLDRLPNEAQAPYGYLDLGVAIQLTKSHPEWLAAVKARGVPCDTEEDLKRIQIDPWPAGVTRWRRCQRGIVRSAVSPLCAKTPLTMATLVRSMA